MPSFLKNCNSALCLLFAITVMAACSGTIACDQLRTFTHLSIAIRSAIQTLMAS
jgi:hypothetical protein